MDIHIHSDGMDANESDSIGNISVYYENEMF